MRKCLAEFGDRVSLNETLREFGARVRKFISKSIAAKLSKSYPNIFIQVTFKRQVATATRSHGIKLNKNKNRADRSIDAFYNRSKLLSCCL